MSTLAINKYIRSNYDIIETWEAGIVLSGPEVKSVKGKQLNLKGSYVSLENGELWIKQMHISPYRPAKSAQMKYDPNRQRKLLIRKRELRSLIGRLNQKGLTILPTKVYTQRRLIKVEIALVRGKKKYDKRAVIKKREVDREIRRELKTKIHQ